MNSTKFATDQRRRVTSWSHFADFVAAIALLACWLVTRPYRGVRHDAILYLGQTLARLAPERFSGDIFLHSPTQDRYSIFSPLMAPLIAHFGIALPEMALLIGCHVLFMLAVWKLIAGWFDRPMRWAALIFVAGMPHTYGGLGEFSYAEPFFTARTIAEPLALFALVQLVRGRVLIAIAWAAPATLFHPLMTLPVLIIGWAVLISRHRAWSSLGVLLLVPVVLAVMGVAPFDDLGRSFDATWFNIIREPDAQAFAQAYSRLDWSPLAFDAIVLLLLSRRREAFAPMRQLVRAALVASGVLTAVWIVGSDLFHNVLLTQLQVWRVYWITHLLAMIVLPGILRELWRESRSGRWCVAALGLAGVAVASNWDTGWACLIWAVVALCVNHWRLEVSQRVANWAVIASVLAAVLISAKVAWFTLLAISRSPDGVNDAGMLQVLAGLPLVVGVLTFGLLALLSKSGGPHRVVAAFAASASVVAGLPMWDQRSAWQRRLEESMESGLPVFDAEIPLNATVYWDYDVVTPWLLARRGNFFSLNQASGLLFDREAARQFSLRKEAMQGIQIQRDICQKIHALTMPAPAPEPEPTCVPSVPLVTEICHAPTHPDFLVFGGAMAMPAVAHWTDTSVNAAKRRKSFYLYSCAQFH